MVFFDNASTTKPFESVLQTMQQVNVENFYNPSALYGKSVALSKQIENAKKQIVSALGGSFFDTLVFTSGATEANNLALQNLAKKNGTLLVSVGEHPSVYNTALQLKNNGFSVEFLNLTNAGVVDQKDLQDKLNSYNVVGVSFMHVSNETGAINNIKELTNLVKKHNPKILVHSDGVQAFAKIPVNVTSLGVDLYTISAHKIHGPKGMGALFVKKGINLKPALFGGEQEKSLRAGTENTAAILGFETAVVQSLKQYKQDVALATDLKQALIQELQTQAPFANVLSLPNSSPFIVVVSVSGIKSETLLHLLEQHGYLVANGSACSSRFSDNRILTAMGLDKTLTTASIRISFDANNTKQQVLEFVPIFAKVAQDYLKLIRK